MICTVMTNFQLRIFLINPICNKFRLESDTYFCNGCMNLKNHQYKQLSILLFSSDWSSVGLLSLFLTDSINLDQ